MKAFDYGRVKALLEKKDVLVIGPGLGGHAETVEFVRRLVEDTTVPVVLDADGINAFVGQTDRLKGQKKVLVLTPHPGEFARLLARSTADVQADRVSWRATLRNSTGCISCSKDTERSTPRLRDRYSSIALATQAWRQAVRVTSWPVFWRVCWARRVFCRHQTIPLRRQTGLGVRTQLLGWKKPLRSASICTAWPATSLQRHKGRSRSLPRISWRPCRQHFGSLKQ